jgi:hypothetical protein
MPFTNSFDNTFPPDTQLANQLGADIRNFKLDIQERLAADSGPLQARPDYSQDAQPSKWTGRLYFATDTKQTFRWNGTGWDDVTSAVGGGGIAQALATTGAPVDVSGAAPPTAGQVLQAADATHAVWASLPTQGGGTILAINQTPVSHNASQGQNVNLALQSLTIPANTLKANQFYRIWAFGKRAEVQGDNDAIDFILTIVQPPITLINANIGFAVSGSIIWYAQASFAVLADGQNGLLTSPIGLVVVPNLGVMNALMPNYGSSPTFNLDTTQQLTLQAYVNFNSNTHVGTSVEQDILLFANG